MVQATDFWNLDDDAESRRFDWPSVGCVLVEREMGSSAMIVGKVRGQDATQVRLAQHENMVQTLAPDRADEPLGEGILPRAMRRRQLCLPLIRPIGSRRSPEVFVMEPTHAGHLHHTALAGRLHTPWLRCVLGQR